MTRSTIRPISALFSFFVMLIFVLSLPGIADARGGGRGGGFSRGGGGGGSFSRSAGGFSRSSAASGGSFSSRSLSRPQAASRPSGTQQRPGATAGMRPAPSGQREQLATRQRPAQPPTGDGAGQRQQQRQESAAGRQEGRPQSQEERQDYRTESREDWQSHMREQQEERQDWVEDEHWDDHWHHDDWDEGGAFVAGAFVGTTMGMAAAATATPTYVTTLPCSTASVIVNGASYYNCGSTWYSRGYAGGSVVYIVSGPP